MISTDQAFALLNNEIQFIIPDTYNRILGQENIHWPIDTVVAYWQSSGARTQWGNYAVKTIIDRTGKIGSPLLFPWKAILVSGISLGSGFTVSLYFWGEITGINTVVTRYRFWEMFLVRGIIMNVQTRVIGPAFKPFNPSLVPKT